jgi:flagellum-specific ATP synthase
VIRIAGSGIVVLPLGANNTISLGNRARPHGNLKVYPDASWKGRICNALAQPLDGRPPLEAGSDPANLLASPPQAMLRGKISERVTTGVRAIDLFTPLCYGQRVGIFAGSGVGKSTLLSMMSRSDGFDSVIVGLVGERGREVKDFVHDVLGDTLEKSIVVVATSDEPPAMRRTAALLATSLAEHFRDRGERVLLVMDSLTRYAQACREISLTAGEPPVARGYPPSVFSELPLLLERAGQGASGTGAITAVYTVLVDGDDHNDPVADTVRGTLDGHIVLDRQIAASGRYPAIDLLQSISRLAPRAWTAQEAATVSRWRKLIVRYEDSRDLRSLGGYVRGGDPELDEAVTLVPQLYMALEQSPNAMSAPPIPALK